ncbi:PREDICTED: uncharacterized protein KIAA0754-like [Prunus mume]|uniref:Uncharacterized protein KIAA0754-like n=1 Tax=Prunus mume TaxID=102107 RepID=A0ABM0NS68_PRUMU|nr:PREDICTED: uncharacterized protein KIAA0754-like [Prunus mume]
MAGISFQLQKGMSFLTLRPWMRRNAVDEDERLWYVECISARFIRPVEEAVRGALKNADWDPLLSKAGKVKKAPAVLSRPSTPAAAVPRVAVASSVRAAVVTSIAAPASRTPAVVGARKTLAHRTPRVAREASSIEAAVVEAALAETVVVEGEEEVEEEAAAEAPGVEEAADPEELVAEEVATAEDTETLGAEEVPATEEPAADMPDDELPAVEPTRATLAEVPSAAPVASSAPHRPRGIVFRSPPRSSLPLSATVISMPPALLPQESVVVTALVVVEAAVTDVPSSPPVFSAVLTELPATATLGAPSAAQETTSSDDLEELYASLHEEGGSLASASLDEDSRAVVENLQEFLFFGVHQMTTAEAFMEFRSCLDTAMAMGLLDSAQLDELQVRLAEGEEMIGRYAEANLRMTEGCSLEQELLAIKEQVQPAMAHLKENDLVVQQENEELAQVEAQIAELQARQALILQR